MNNSQTRFPRASNPLRRGMRSVMAFPWSLVLYFVSVMVVTVRHFIISKIETEMLSLFCCS